MHLEGRREEVAFWQQSARAAEQVAKQVAVLQCHRHQRRTCVRTTASRKGSRSSSSVSPACHSLLSCRVDGDSECVCGGGRGAWNA